MADTSLDALRRSVERLQIFAEDLTELVRRAYPSDRTIAVVLSHLGSGAVISQRRLTDVVAGTNLRTTLRRPSETTARRRAAPPPSALRCRGPPLSVL